MSLTFLCLSLVPSYFHSKIIRYPDRSRQQQSQQPRQGDRRSFSNYDPASAFRNSAAAAAAAASADDLYGFSYDPQVPRDQNRERNDDERRRQRPEQDYPRRNASNTGYYNKEIRNLATLQCPSVLPLCLPSSTSQRHKVSLANGLYSAVQIKYGQTLLTQP